MVILDANQDTIQKAQADGLQVVFGNATDERVMLSAKMESRRGIVGLLTTWAQNLLVAQMGREEGGAPQAWVAIQRGPGAPDPRSVVATNARILFAGPQDIDLWGMRVGQKLTRLEMWKWQKTRENSPDTGWQISREGRNQLLPILLHRGRGQHLIDEKTHLKDGDQVEWLILAEVADSAHERLREQGWTLMEELKEENV